MSSSVIVYNSYILLKIVRFLGPRYTFIWYIYKVIYTAQFSWLKPKKNVFPKPMKVIIRRVHMCSVSAELGVVCQRISDRLFSVASTTVWNRFTSSRITTRCATTSDKTTASVCSSSRCLLLFRQLSTTAPRPSLAGRRAQKSFSKLTTHAISTCCFYLTTFQSKRTSTRWIICTWTIPENGCLVPSPPFQMNCLRTGQLDTQVLLVSTDPPGQLGRKEIAEQQGRKDRLVRASTCRQHRIPRPTTPAVQWVSSRSPGSVFSPSHLLRSLSSLCAFLWDDDSTTKKSSTANSKVLTTTPSQENAARRRPPETMMWAHHLLLYYTSP